MKVNQLHITDIHYQRAFSHIISFIMLNVVLLLCVPNVFADSRRVDQFNYDGSGNIVGKNSQVFTQPPAIVNVTPTFINRGRSINVLATGTDLLSVQVSTSDTEVTVSNILSTTTSVSFTLSASMQASLGAMTLTFSTSLGSDVRTMTVYEVAPDILTEPNPISIAANNRPNTITLQIDPRAVDQTYNFNITDTSFATLTSNSIVIPANETSATFEITGLVLGNTELNISANDASFTFNSSFPVLVTEPLTGDIFEASLPVGIIFGTENPTGVIETSLLPSTTVGLIVGTENPTGVIETSLLPSTTVGLIVGTENPTGVIETSLLPSTTVGLIVGTENPTGVIETSLLPSTTVGLIVGTENPTGVIETSLLPAPIAGILIGSHVFSVTPTTVASGENTNIVITGANLQNVTGVTISPGTGITLGVFSVDVSGSTITVPVSIDAAATPSTHQITVTTSAGTVPVVEALNLELIIQ